MKNILSDFYQIVCDIRILICSKLVRNHGVNCALGWWTSTDAYNFHPRNKTKARLKISKGCIRKNGFVAFYSCRADVIDKLWKFVPIASFIANVFIFKRAYFEMHFFDNMRKFTEIITAKFSTCKIQPKLLFRVKSYKQGIYCIFCI